MFAPGRSRPSGLQPRVGSVVAGRRELEQRVRLLGMSPDGVGAQRWRDDFPGDAVEPKIVPAKISGHRTKVIDVPRDRMEVLAEAREELANRRLIRVGLLRQHYR